MHKFTLKIFIILITMISGLFFLLILFQKMAMEKTMEMNSYGYPPQASMRTFSNMPSNIPSGAPENEPPFAVPLMFIVVVSSIFIIIVLKYIEVNFIIPLSDIETNIKKIKEGSLEVKFQTKCENETTKETFLTLNEMVQELKEKEKLQDNFIQNLVHDLRTPVIAQERAMEILSEEMEDNPLIKGMVENNDAYLKMINYIIDAFSKKEVKIEKIDFNLSIPVKNVITALKSASDAKNITVKSEVSPDFILYADYISINRIIMNLVSNAIENIENDKTVTIKALKDNEKTTLIVEDNGHGIEEDNIKLLFAKYISIKKTNSKKSVSGLGLSIVQNLVHKNGGIIYVNSKKDEYTKFIIELPNKENVWNTTF